jgi:hypothetical protein
MFPEAMALRYVRSDSVVARVIGGETLVVPVHGDVGDLASVYSFNQTGTKIWEALASPMTAEELARVVESEFSTTVEAARADIERFLEEACAKGIVRRLAPGVER